MGYYSAEETEQIHKQQYIIDDLFGRVEHKKATEIIENNISLLSSISIEPNGSLYHNSVDPMDLNSSTSIPMSKYTSFEEGPCYLSLLSEEHWLMIFRNLDSKSLICLSECCSSFYRISNDRHLWENLLKNDRGKVLMLPSNIDIQNPKQIYRYRQDFETISDALSHQAEETKREILLVAPGVYKECLKITKPVDIIGQGKLGECIVESNTGNTISISAHTGSMVNIATRQHGHWFCIDIEQGSFSISKCDITNSTLSAIKIGKQASPWISDNIIHDCKEAGIAIFGGQGTIIGNRFTRNRYGSIEIVYSTSQPVIKLNRIYRNKGYGIHVHTNANAIISENIIEENESDGISCWGGASPVVSNNKICNNLEDGIYIHEDGKGIYEHNQIFGQKLDGIRISKSNPEISHNIIHHNQGDGVRLVIRANPVIKDNHICENKRVGVHIYREGMGIVSNNFIYNNKNAGMQIYSRANATIINNRICQNKCSGVYVSDYAIVNLKGNEISYNGEVGVELVSGAKALSFEQNQISSNYEAGLAYYIDSKPLGYETQNYFSKNGPHGDKQFIMRQGREIMMYQNGRKEDSEPISFLVENALQEGVCTLSFTREYYHAQYWYECKTCSEPRKILGKSEVAICEECARKCHAGHDIGVRKYGHFYCDSFSMLNQPTALPKNFIRQYHGFHHQDCSASSSFLIE
ncbi:hypothetical protein DLAC_03112 [Tieghemostelium lacteum]|uniref:F-box domain-containing protein n=1 Tax=Tieghemostelium lacteum TaxID=361077 RepID=A0A152A2M6_TIELA|nr:hypothetical protein DLAC_03112 [Tieghemostelium lacteum]|eukprot:KYR00367.1 hypothetical protein DLAC_03112 [Tieghemostelium lacteum]